MNDIIITADILLPISSKPLYKSAIAISDGVIINIGNPEDIINKYPDSEIIRKDNCIILPGFINAHTHLELGWIKNKLGGFNNFIEWLEQIIIAKRNVIDRETISEAVKHGVETLIESGVTTVGEISSYNGIDKELLKNSGLRTVLFVEIFDWNLNLLDENTFENNDIFEERPFPHAPYSCSPQTLDKVFTFSRENNIPLSIHLAESTDEVNFLKNLSNGFETRIFPLLQKENFTRIYSESPTSYISKFNKDNSSKYTAVHMVQLNENDLNIIKNRNVGIVLCPRSNLLLKVGNPRFDLLKEIEYIGIGTDGLSSNYNLNFFEEIRALHNLLLESNMDKDTFRTIYYSTLGGAKALFLDDKTGSIEVGKQADLICLNFGNEIPVDPYLFVISSDNKNLEFSMVNGRFLFNKH
ncbi:MAG: amidohydrolase family protein [Candidatus Dadabacteria bacterium]|nr:amidohydrolase family protein [Candidatus Dadabacteria bacterium]NIQ15006.1 amidohydrolase family protein [Candidatus Dadabacteria bacterium]